MKEILEFYAGRCEPDAALKAAEPMTKAAGLFRVDHSMGKVAVMHAKLRNWLVEEAGESQP